jgi:cytochrome c-type biogenesis protein CcmH
MIFWAIIGALTAVCLGFLLVPLLRRRRPAPDRGAFDREVYRDQLDEIARDLKRGVLSDEEAAAARVEVERRILATAQSQPETGSAPTRRPLAGRRLLVATSLAGIMAALALYLYLGEPGLPGRPFAERAGLPAGADEGMDLAQIEQLVARLATRLEGDPDNLEGWRLLARSYMMLGRYENAAEAFDHAAALDPGDAELPAGQGEALVMANGGFVTPAAKRAFVAARALDGTEPRARFYLGLAEMQAGRPRAALELWERLAADAPLDAPWLPELERGIARLKEALRSRPEEGEGGN